jgi:hypothetical protein
MRGFLNNLYFIISAVYLFSYNNTLKAQIGNFVYNGSFELKYDCDPPYVINKAMGWFNIGADSNAIAGVLYSTEAGCLNAPYTDVGFQWPHSGNTFVRTTFYCWEYLCPFYASRGYPKNRLKSNLTQGKTYCVKLHVSLENLSTYATSDISVFFGDNSTDTIRYSNGPITYLNPQIKNPINNVVTDTMNWVPITGTFVATGNEKYLVIGNFESNATTNLSLMIIADSVYKFTEYFVDDVSCIEVNLPAYAGADKSVIAGDSVYIGRESDFAIDPGCIWYKLPNTTTAIDTSSGLWVKPTSTSTYVVKQVLDCSPEKWDTVVVYMNLVGLEKLKIIKEELRIYPVPAKDFIELKISNRALFEGFNSIALYNNLGQLIKEEEISFKEDKLIISTIDFKPGVYVLKIKSNTYGTLSQRFLISQYH